jgi:hypothetical protein
MEGEGRWETDGPWTADELETTPFIDPAERVKDEPPPSMAKKIWNRVFGIFVAATIGAYAGLVSATLQESWIYAASFIGEALVCACVAGIIRNTYFKRSVAGIALYFVISAIVTPIACYIGFQSTMS